MEPDAKRQKHEDDSFIVCANTSLSFRWVEYDDATGHLIEGDITKPLFTHAFFGEDEVIRGYRRLDVSIMIDAASFTTLLEIDCEEALDQADDIRSMIEDKFEYSFMDSKNAFIDQIAKFDDDWIDLDAFGNQASLPTPFLDGTIVITQIRLTEANEKLKGMHYRLEPFLMFFIDGFQCIDTSDPDWTLFCAIFIKRKKHRLIGYSTVYQFYSFPDQHRHRIGQMFVLPSYQRKGVASKMLEAIQSHAEKCNGVDLSIEDPTEPILRMKQTFDMKRMMNCQRVRDLIEAKQNRVLTNVDTEVMLSKDEEIEIHQTLRIPIREIDALWAALLLSNVIDQPEAVSKMKQHIERQWKATFTSNVQSKAIFNELTDTLEPRDDFIMMKCKHDGFPKIVDQVLIIPATNVDGRDTQIEVLLQRKLATAWELASHFVLRHS